MNNKGGLATKRLRFFAVVASWSCGGVFKASREWRGGMIVVKVILGMSGTIVCDTNSEVPYLPPIVESLYVDCGEEVKERQTANSSSDFGGRYSQELL